MTIEGRINFLTIYTRKLEECREFYTALLGEPLIREQHGNSPVHYSTRIGDAIIEFYPTRGEATKLRIGVIVDSLEETLARVHEKYPLSYTSPRDPTNCRIRLICDPDKRQVEVQYRGEK